MIAPGGMPQDFENRTAKRASMLNVSVPGDFEPHMTGIAEWFRDRPAAESRTANAPTARTTSAPRTRSRSKRRA